MVDVVVTDECRDWLLSLDEDDHRAVVRDVDILEARGVHLGFPKSSAIEGSRYSFRELRIQSKGRPIRIFYAFDPKRDAVLLIGGDKTGDDRFYKQMIPIAERIWERYLDEQKRGQDG